MGWHITCTKCGNVCTHNIEIMIKKKTFHKAMPSHFEKPYAQTRAHIGQ